MVKDIVFKVAAIEFPVADVIKLTLKAGQPLPKIRAGQFLNLEVPVRSLILRRPFCIYDYDKRTVVTYAAVVGKGTAALAKVKKGDSLLATMPLGNGFFIPQYKNVGLLGGGIGCAELFSATKDKGADGGRKFYAYLGFAHKDRVLFTDDFAVTCDKVVVCTGDGSYGVKGYPMTELKKDLAKLDAVLVCGPLGMVKALQAELKDIDIPVFVSMEQRMACGVGACLVCTCPVADGGVVKNKRVCFDGPVFELKDLVL